MATERNAVMQWFAHPGGLLGDVIGDFMATENHALNLWAIEMLDIQAEDNILEIGFGAGTAIEALEKLPIEGYIAGVDYSELMVAKAKRRNKAAIKSGRIDLRHGSAENLPSFGVTFDKIFAVNNAMYWQNPAQALNQLRQHLCPGGSVTLVYQRITPHVNCEAPYIGTEMQWYMQCLYDAGFCNVEIISQPLQKMQKQLNKFTLAGLMNKPLSQIYGVENVPLSGICVRATNPTIFNVLDYYFSWPRPYMTSRRLFIQRQACQA